MVDREQRLVFGEVADLYDRVRPTYPEALVDRVLGLIGPPAPRVVDVGCGTGKAAVMLAARGVTGVGVEPHGGMAAVARRNLAAHPGWEVVESSFEDWEGPAGQFDLVVSAQAWHWVDPDVRLHKAHRLLGPEGWIALWWNRPADDWSSLRGALDEVYERIAPTLVAGGPGSGRPPGCSIHADDPIRAEAPFGDPLTEDYPWEQTYTTADYVDLMRTQSGHRLLPDAQRDRLWRAIGEVVDAAGGTIAVHYVCQLWAAPRG